MSEREGINRRETLGIGKDSATTDLDEIGRAETLKQLFGDVGDLMEDFTCAVQSNVLLHGRMYVTDKFLCFYSNLFGLEKKIRIPYSHITLITKENTAFVIPNAIAITTYRKEYLFRSFWDRDECYNMLQNCLSKSKSGGGSVSPADSSPQSPSGDNSGISPQAPVRIRSETISDKRQSLLRSTGRSVSAAEEETDTENGRKELDDSSQPSEDTNHEAALEQEISKCKLKIAVRTEVLNISLSTFIKAFIDESAPFSWKRYHESKGDLNLEVNQWTAATSTFGNTR